MSVEVSGFDDIFKNLTEMGKDIEKVEKKALKKAGKVVAKEISKNAPKSIMVKKATKKSKWRTGKHAADNVPVGRVKTDKYGEKSVSIGWDIGDNSPYFYMKFLEFGTSKITARPFMGRSLDNTEKEVFETITNEMKKAIE